MKHALFICITASATPAAENKKILSFETQHRRKTDKEIPNEIMFIYTKRQTNTCIVQLHESALITVRICFERPNKKNGPDKITGSFVLVNSTVEQEATFPPTKQKCQSSLPKETVVQHGTVQQQELPEQSLSTSSTERQTNSSERFRLRGECQQLSRLRTA